jgi:chorismate-pyruvate lyase
LCYDDPGVHLPPTYKMPYGNAGMRCRWIGTIVTLNLCASAISADPALRRTGAPWPDTFLARVEALALIETLNASLLCASCTATEVLDKWCADHKLASEPLVHARRITGTEKPVSPEQRQRLQIGPEEEVTYRHVELICGGHILVEADNWYVPRRVGVEINHVLTTTDTPFGRAVHDLKPTRENFSVEILWKPLPDGWELGPPPADRPEATMAMPWQLFQHRAVIYNYRHEPFSEVREIFTREVLAFGPP